MAGNPEHWERKEFIEPDWEQTGNKTGNTGNIVISADLSITPFEPLPYGPKTGFWTLAADSAMKEGDAGMEHCPKSCFDAKSLLVETPVERRVRMSSAIASRLAPGFHAAAR